MSEQKAYVIMKSLLCLFGEDMLSDLYPYIFETLGKSEDDPSFLLLKQFVGEPSKTYEVGSLRNLDFTSCGISLVYSAKYNRFCGLGFHMKDREYRRFSGCSLKGRETVKIILLPLRLDEFIQVNRTVMSRQGRYRVHTACTILGNTD